MRVTVSASALFGLMVLIVACAIMAIESFERFTNQTKYPLPLSDWVYDAAVKNDPTHAAYYVNV